MGWRSWRCVRFRYSRSLHSNCVAKLKSWQCCSPLLHWRRKTRGSRALITMNSCSWGNFLSGRKGRSCRDGTEEGRGQWNTVLSILNGKNVNPRPRTCAELLQVVAEVNVQLGYLKGDPERGDKPRCKTGVHAGARRQCFWRHQLITGKLGSTVAVRTGGETTPVVVHIFATMIREVSYISYKKMMVTTQVPIHVQQKWIYWVIISIGY